LTEFGIGILLAVNIDRSVRKTKRSGQADFWKLRIFRDWVVRKDIFELSKSGKCRREQWNGQKEGRFPCKSFSYVDYSVCF
jgi:hypothetical protein